MASKYDVLIRRVVDHYVDVFSPSLVIRWWVYQEVWGLELLVSFECLDDLEFVVSSFDGAVGPD